MPALRADGSEVLVELTIVPIFTEGPQLFTAYLRDITERKHSEEVLSERGRLTALRADLSARLATAEPLRAVAAAVHRTAGAAPGHGIRADLDAERCRLDSSCGEAPPARRCAGTRAR